jgi:hypothetical protein
MIPMPIVTVSPGIPRHTCPHCGQPSVIVKSTLGPVCAVCEKPALKTQLGGGGVLGTDAPPLGSR